MSPPRAGRRPRLAYETRLTLLALACGLPALGAALVFLWTSSIAAPLRWTLALVLAGFWLGFAFALRERVMRPLHSVANLLSALQSGDYSVRAPAPHLGDALDGLYREVNTLGDTLQSQRFGALEATALLRTVMVEIDVAVFTFDQDRRLRLVNRAGERLLGRSAEQMLGRRAAELGLEDCLDGEATGTSDRVFPGGYGRWGVRVRTFREDGLPHQLLVIEDLTRTLREEELRAWKRLVRVLGHEINNSLTPIRSIAGSLGGMMMRDPLPEGWRPDAQRGLEIMSSRAEALTRFIDAYSRLAKLPQPAPGPVAVAAWVRRTVALETRAPITVESGPELTLQADADQLEQLLINLLRNAAEASLETGGSVSVAWWQKEDLLELAVRDSGPGLSNSANLFVPFFTTKPGGSGIGLVLCRQIAEAHGGTLTLANRNPGPGCEAVLRLPVS